MQPALSGPIHAVPVEEDDPIITLREELDELRDEFDGLRKNYERDRAQWAAILSSLQAAFGGGPVTSVESGGAPMPQSSAAWQMWRDRLPGACPKVIDALLIQPLTATQLIAATKTSYSTVNRALEVLRNNALLEKDGDRWKLKRL